MKNLDVIMKRAIHKVIKKSAKTKYANLNSIETAFKTHFPSYEFEDYREYAENNIKITHNK